MKPHTKIYLTYFGYDTTDFIPCEVCGSQSTDIHHLSCRGMGGSKTKDVIENLQALEDDGEPYENIEEIWPDYPPKDDFFFNDDEY